MSKIDTYRELVARRKACTACPATDLANPSQLENGDYDSDEIGPWSIWQHNLDARLMVIGQDWGTVGNLKSSHDDPHNPTNRRLSCLLEGVGIDVPEPPTAGHPVDKHVIFLTNAVLCLKCERSMLGPVKREWFDNCGPRFLRPLIELVAPRVVVTLGRWATDTVLRTHGLRTPKRLRDAVEDTNGVELTNGTLLYPLYHCGNRVLNSHRCWEQQVTDWARPRAVLTQ